MSGNHLAESLSNMIIRNNLITDWLESLLVLNKHEDPVSSVHPEIETNQ